MTRRVVAALIEREARRVAAALEASRWKLDDEQRWWHKGVLKEGEEVWFQLSAYPIGQLNRLEICGGAFDGHVIYGRSLVGEWKVWGAQTRHIRLDELLARALYRLGIEDESVFSQLPPLSAHQKMELRLTLGREFWPQNWVSEVEETSSPRRYRECQNQ